jgi:chromosomal replication initiator protein
MLDKTFENFIVGPCNRFAHAAVSHLESGGVRPSSPVIVYGPGGAGKSHLLRACVGRRNRRQRAAFLSALDFHEVPTATLTAWLDVVGRGFTLLAVDDLDYLTHEMQRRLLKVVSAMTSSGAAVVLSCGAFPDHNARLTSGFRETLNAGTIADLRPLDADTRLGMADQLAAECELVLPADVRVWARVRLPENGLLIYSWWIRFAATMTLERVPASVDLAQGVLEEMAKPSTQAVRSSPDESEWDRLERRLHDLRLAKKLHRVH